MDGGILSFALVLLFVLIGGYFAASEIALVSLREGQVRRLAGQGARGARVARLRGDPSRFLSSVQIGVTFAGFFASSFGAATIAVDLQPVLSGWGLSEALAATTALVLVTLVVSYVSLVLGELVPKRLALQRSESVAVFVAPVLDRVATIFRPVIWLLSVSTNAVVRLFGIDPHARGDGVSEEELREMVRSHEELPAEQRYVLDDVFTAADRVLREVMVPRTEVDFLPSSMLLADAISHVVARPHSRYPVIGETTDDVVGFVHVRDVLTAAHCDAGDGARTVGDIAREAVALPGSKALLPALSQMRHSAHLAVVVDEYGGTDGVVTLEDLIEELIGDVQDEYDSRPRRPDLVRDGVAELDGLLHRDDVEELTGLTLPEGSYNTLAGYVLIALGRAPSAGDSVDALDHRFTVLEMDGRRVARVRIAPRDPEPGDRAPS